MKIVVKADHTRLRFWVPNALLNEKVIRIFTKDAVPPELLGQIKELRRALKAYVKANGHFTLVEITSHDAYVKISV